MAFGKNIPDKTILINANKKLARGAGSQNRITVTVSNGTVTLMGMLRFEIHRRSIVKSVRSAAGVRNVIDNLKSEPRKKDWNK